MSLSNDALQSMDPPKSLVFKLSETAIEAAKKIPVGTPDPITGEIKKPRGRPPGSKNVRTQSATVNPPMSLRGSNPSRPKDTDKVDDKAATKEQKKLRAEQYATYINTELNDKLFMLLSSMPGSPIKLQDFYKENKVPPSVAVNPNLSDLGNAVAIPGDVADSWGKLLAELSYTDLGKTASKVTGNPMLGIASAVITALYSTYRYTQQLKPILDQIKQVQEAQRQAAEAAEKANGTPSGDS